MKLSPEFATIVFWLAVASCVVAQLGIVWSTWRGLSNREAAPAPAGDPAPVVSPRPKQIRRAPELLWAILPAIALVLVFMSAWRAMHTVADAGDMPIHRHPPATVSGAPSQLAVHEAPRQRAHAIHHSPPPMAPVAAVEGAKVETADSPEVPQR